MLAMNAKLAFSDSSSSKNMPKRKAINHLNAMNAVSASPGEMLAVVMQASIPLAVTIPVRAAKNTKADRLSRGVIS
jgi:hypothetical protein